MLKYKTENKNIVRLQKHVTNKHQNAINTGKRLKNKSREDLKLLAAGLNIPVLVEIEEVKTKGWQGSAKGLLQILWD